MKKRDEVLKERQARQKEKTGQETKQNLKNSKADKFKEPEYHATLGH